MRRWIAGVWLAALAAVPLGAQAARLVFPTSGYSIAPLEAQTDTDIYQSLMMFLPATESFAPNVNVQIQRSAWSLAEFVSVSREQFESMGLEIIRETRAKTSATWEYAGVMNGQTLHWYTVAHAVAGRFYVVTATAAESQWRSVGAELRACVDSFRLEQD